MTKSDDQKEKRLEDAAKRALSEAKTREEQAAKDALPTELGGRDGLEPTRYGDWEKKGIVSDF